MATGDVHILGAKVANLPKTLRRTTGINRAVDTRFFYFYFRLFNPTFALRNVGRKKE